MSTPQHYEILRGTSFYIGAALEVDAANNYVFKIEMITETMIRVKGGDVAELKRLVEERIGVMAGAEEITEQMEVGEVSGAMSCESANPDAAKRATEAALQDDNDEGPDWAIDTTTTATADRGSPDTATYDEGNEVQTTSAQEREETNGRHRLPSEDEELMERLFLAKHQYPWNGASRPPFEKPPLPDVSEKARPEAFDDDFDR